MSFIITFDFDGTSFLCQFKGKVTIDYNLTINLGNGIIYHTTLLDAVGCWDAATEYLSDAFNSIVNPSLT
jgi:hypothetical protein